jgi:hypothetical protein
LVVAKAYIDQLERSQSLPADRINALRDAVQKAESSNMNKKDLGNLKKLAKSLEKDPGVPSTNPNANSVRLDLIEILKRPSR